MPVTADLDQPDPLAAHAAEAGALLRELAEIGMDMSRSLGRFARALAASAPEDQPPTPDQIQAADGLMRAFSCVSRSVRQSLALRGRLIADVAKSHARAEAETARRVEAEEAVLKARRGQGKLRRAMADYMAHSAIEALERDPVETERLHDALVASRDDTLDDADFADIDVDTVALQLCEALGVDPGLDWWRTKWGMEHPPVLRRPEQPLPKPAFPAPPPPPPP